MITVQIKDKPALVSDSIDKFKFVLDETNEQVLVKYKDNDLGVMVDVLGCSIEDLEKQIIAK